MGHAIIVFADGSKQMAHNLDDLRFRWHERKLSQAEETLDMLRTEQVVIRCEEPENILQANRFISELKSQAASLRRTEATLQRGSPSAEKRDALLGLRAAIMECESRRAQLAAWVTEQLIIQQNTPKSPNKSQILHMERQERRAYQVSRENVRQRVYICYMMRHIQHLETLLADAGITAPPLVNGRALSDVMDERTDRIREQIEAGEIANDAIGAALRQLAGDVYAAVYGESVQAADD